MGQLRLRQLRAWMVFITVLNFTFMVACYVCIGFVNWPSKTYNDRTLRWGDWAIIISTIGFTFFYTPSLLGSGFQNVPKYLRTFLLLVPTIVVLYVTCVTIHLKLLAYSKYGSDNGPFTCKDLDKYTCRLRYINLFMALISALFVVIEIWATLAWGPLEKVEETVEETPGEYVPNPDIILVIPVHLY
ncbi:hypothetical protein BGW39_000137 [Mortierella sp. 14UC]|nr:hypothetical protein BGW39_000137 [Mortierella sp. 14UC]